MFFRVLEKDKNTNARAGLIETNHGVVETPCYVMVGTHAAVRCLTPDDIPGTKTQAIIANTYHLWKRLGDGGLNEFEGLHKRMKWDGLIMTDSGGFQVFSLGFAREHNAGKVCSFRNNHPNTGAISNGAIKNLVRITDDGVYFIDEDKTLLNGPVNKQEYYIDAKLSIEIQKKLGADIIFAFDECTSPFHDWEYTKKSLGRTNRWALSSLNSERGNGQKLYGIVQGGAFRDLREESARFIGGQPFDGIGIGGSFGERGGGEMTDVLDWIIPILPADKPRHLLGIGTIRDIFEAVERGVDTFDCVIPTREARHGSLWVWNGGFDKLTARRFDVRKNIYKGDTSKIEDSCECPVCGGLKITRGQLHEFFRSYNSEKPPVLDSDPGRLATIHNVFFFNDLMDRIRSSIKDGTFSDLKQAFLSRILKT